MKIDLNHLPCITYMGFRRAFERSNLAETQHFHEWLTRGAKLSFDTPLALFTLTTSISLSHFSHEERRIILVARAVAQFLLRLCREVHAEAGIGEEAAYLNWEQLALSECRQNPPVQAPARSVAIDAGTDGWLARGHYRRGELRVQASRGGQVIYDEFLVRLDEMWAAEVARGFGVTSFPAISGMRRAP